jgi:hypothetical protein
LTLARVWGALGVGGIAAGALAAAVTGDIGHAATAGSGIGALALASARGSDALRYPWLRDLSGLAGLGSYSLVTVGAEVEDVVIALGVVAISLAATTAFLALWHQRPESVWLRPLAILGIAASIEALFLAVGALPDRALLVTVLLAVGVQALAAGLTVKETVLLASAPPLIGVAFLLAVGEYASGSAQWLTAPIGVVLLAEVEIWRMQRKAAGESLTTPEVIVPEWVGIGLLGGPPLVEMFTNTVLYGLAAFAVAALCLVWAAATRVKRRTIAAGSLAVGTSVLILFAAAAGSAPDSAFFWLVAIGVGFAVRLVAALVEAYRSRKGRVMTRIGSLMEGWE